MPLATLGVLPIVFSVLLIQKKLARGHNILAETFIIEDKSALLWAKKQKFWRVQSQEEILEWTYSFVDR